MPCRASVVLHLPAARVLPFVEDGSVEPLGPDRCILVTGAWSWNALAAQLGRFDCEIEVPDAPELRSALATLADRFARAAG